MNSRGFTLVETLVALCLLGVAASVMVAPLYQYARNVNGIGMVQARNGLTTREANRLLTMPYDSLASRAGCVTVTRAPLPHQRCVTVSASGANRLRVELLIAPAAGAARPDTVVLERARAAVASPFTP